MNPLIKTKFGIPACRPALVERRRLVERLDAGLNGNLTLISAPAGYGKTTLASRWLRGTTRAVTWLSLDGHDNDPVRFLNYFIAALQAIDEQVGKETQPLLQAPQPPPPDVLMTTLLNELSEIPLPFILALDDYHVIQTVSTHNLLNFIVEHQPDQMHIVLLTREDPPLPLPRLRARGQITEVRQDDLRFTTQECAEFLENVMGIKMSQDDISALERRTEGWVTGLQLAALSMRGRDDLSHFVQEFTGSNRFVLDFLAQEVFEKQTKDIQDFLLKTSILDRLCGSLCDSVTERSGSQELLDSLEQANLFVTSLDQSRNWYRYHHLFRELLGKKLCDQDVPAINALHRRACSWYERNDILPDAIGHALAGADWESALVLIHKIHGGMLKSGEIFTLLNWYNRLPDHAILNDAEACLNFSWILMLSSQFDRAKFYLTHAEGNAGDNPPFQGQIFSAQAYLARAQGDHRRMVELSQQALLLLPKEDLNSRCIVSINLGIAYWHSGKMAAAERSLDEVMETGKATGNLYAVSTASLFQGMVMAVRGKLHEANDRFLTIVQQRDTPAFLRGLAYFYLCVLHYEWNHLEQSGKYLLEARKIGEYIHNDELFVINHMMMARIHMASGNLAAAGEALDKTQQKAAEGEVSAPVFPRLAAAQVQYAIACNDLEAASVWAKRLVDGSDCHTFHRFTNTTRALYLLAQQKTGEAAKLLEQCYERAFQEGWVYSMIIVRSLQALAAAEPETAFAYFQDALTWAQPEGFIRTFVDLGDVLEPLLQTAARRRFMPEYTERIISVMKESAQSPLLGQLALAEPLNPRELEVLGQMAAGLSNRQIAEKLFISTGTVKTHIHNICGKLGAQNRTEAAAFARALSLV